MRNKPFNEGYNAATGEYVDMLAAGIVDPAKVTRSGLQNAASIAGMVLTTECIVADMPEKKEAAPPAVAAWAAATSTTDRQFAAPDFAPVPKTRSPQGPRVFFACPAQRRESSSRPSSTEASSTM